MHAIIHNMFLQYSVLEVEESTDIRGKLNNSSIIMNITFKCSLIPLLVYYDVRAEGNQVCIYRRSSDTKYGCVDRKPMNTAHCQCINLCR